MLMDLPYLLFFLSQDEDLQRHRGIDGKHCAGPSSMLPKGSERIQRLCACRMEGHTGRGEPPRLSQEVNLEDLTAFANSLEAREDMFA